jgi:RimJ/RimL family protein N-acetyltransferase
MADGPLSMTDADRLPTIPTPRLLLRWLTERDVDALFTVFSHPEVMRFWSSPPLPDTEAARGLLEHIHESFHQQTLFQWGIARREDDLVIGTCTLFHLDRDNRRAEVGFALGREHWGQGYAREALTALLDFAFGEWDLHRLEADADPRNAASIRALERLGFQREGYLRERWHVGGEIQDAVFLGLLQREWEAGRATRTWVPIARP